MKTNSTEAAINRQIEEYNNLKLLNTDNVSDGVHTFGSLYNELFILEQQLKDCLNELTICKSENNNI